MSIAIALGSYVLIMLAWSFVVTFTFWNIYFGE